MHRYSIPTSRAIVALEIFPLCTAEGYGYWFLDSRGRPGEILGVTDTVLDALADATQTLRRMEDADRVISICSAAGWRGGRAA